MHITKLLSGLIVLVSLQLGQGAVEVVPPEVVVAGLSAIAAITQLVLAKVV